MESFRLVEMVPLVISLSSALDQAMLDQRALRMEFERLQDRNDELERQRPGGQPQGPHRLA